jgi:hypothetical protein
MSHERSQDRPAVGAGTVLIAVGVFFLLGQYLNFNFWGVAWPFFVILPGLMFLGGMFFFEGILNLGASSLVLPDTVQGRSC